MNHCAVQQKAFASREEVRRSSISISGLERSETVFCPKPRRIVLLSPSLNDHHPARPLRWHASHQVELFESKGGSDALDIVPTKGGCRSDQIFTPATSSPPFFSGSPPSRVSNPLPQDTRFRDGVTVSQLSPSIKPPSPSSATRKGGCVRGSFSDSPAVRIEGFDCLDRDHRNCSIPALA